MLIIEAIAFHAMEFLTAITVLMLYFYTKETYLLRKEAQKQTAATYTPYLTLRAHDGNVHISNLGQGIAKDVCFNGLVINDHTVCDVPTVAPHEKRELRVYDKENSGYWSILSRDVPDEIYFSYKDILGNEYNAKFTKDTAVQGGFLESFQSLDKTRVGI